MKTKQEILLAVSIILFFQLFTSEKVRAKEREYPEKAIQFLCGMVAGSVFDVSIRVIAKVASKYIEKPIVVVNMPGATGTVAFNEVAKSAPDGYTIASMPSAYQSLTLYQQKVPFDPKVLKPLLSYAQFRQLLYVRGDSPYAKLEDFIAYGQKNPGAIKWGHSGKGTGTNLMGMLFFRSANIKSVDVPFKGTPEYIQAVIGGHILAGIIDVSGIRSFVSAGTLKPVVVFPNQRIKEFPDVPTSKEKGYADVSLANSLLCIVIHRETPPDRLKKLHDALRKVVEDPEFVKIMEDIGMEAAYTSPEVVEETILKEKKLGIPLLKELNLFLE